MEKYLFTDGTNVIREVESDEELQKLILSSAEPGKVRIWIFNTNEWLSLADFNKLSHKAIVPVKKIVSTVTSNVPAPPAPKNRFSGIVKKILVAVAAAGAIFIVYNFTKLTWRKTTSLTLSAGRPANTPETNIDSLIATIEALRGQKLDKVTRTNLRIRNSWPDLIQLQLTSDRDTSREGLKFYNIELSIDNSTGYNLDNAVAKISFWRDKQVSQSDTIHFSNINYSSPAKRSVPGTIKADSVSVAFTFIKSKVFNFCYSSDKKSNYGNYNDRWYCK